MNKEGIDLQETRSYLSRVKADFMHSPLNAFLFSGTVRENYTAGQCTATDDEIKQKALRLHLKRSEAQKRTKDFGGKSSC